MYRSRQGFYRPCARGLGLLHNIDLPFAYFGRNSRQRGRGDGCADRCTEGGILRAAVRARVSLTDQCETHGCVCSVKSAAGVRCECALWYSYSYLSTHCSRIGRNDQRRPLSGAPGPTRHGTPKHMRVHNVSRRLPTLGGLHWPAQCEPRRSEARAVYTMPSPWALHMLQQSWSSVDPLFCHSACKYTPPSLPIPEEQRHPTACRLKSGASAGQALRSPGPRSYRQQDEIKPPGLSDCVPSPWPRKPDCVPPQWPLTGYPLIKNLLLNC